MERLVGQLLLQGQLPTTWLLRRHEDRHRRECEGQEAQILQQPTPGRERVGGGLSDAQIMDTATVVAPLAEEPAPVATVPAATPESPLFAHDGTERRIVRPQDPVEQTDCYSGKKKDHTVKNVLLVNALLTILFLSDTYGGRVHDLRIAEATPYPLPAGSRLVQALGFLSFTLPEVTILMPTKKPRAQELTLEQQLANQALHDRRLRIEHVNSSVKRCRIVKDRIRLWKAGVRDLVMELCCALHNFRVRLNPWLPMI